MLPTASSPPGFLFVSGGSLNFAGVGTLVYTQLPADGVHSINATDTFVFNSVLSVSTNVDIILDFLSGTDKIQLSASIFGAFGGQIGQTIGINSNLLYDNVNGVLAYDADGAGGVAATGFAIIGMGTHPVTMGNDFLIIN